MQDVVRSDAPRSDARLLLVADEGDARDALLATLRKAPISLDVMLATVDVALAGALADGRLPRPDLIVIDAGASASAVDFLKTLRSKGALREVSVIAVIAGDDPRLHRTLTEAGADAVVQAGRTPESRSRVARAVTEHWFRSAETFFLD